MLKIVFIFIAPLLLVAFSKKLPTTTTTTTRPPVSTTIPGEITQFHFSWERLSEGGIPAREWSRHLAISIEENLTDLSKAKDIKDFCPKYSSLDHDSKIRFWGELFVAMAKYESNFKPSTSYKECNATKCNYSNGCQFHKEYGYCMKGGHRLDGGIVISRGLIQMSLESSLGYGCSFLKTPQDLHDPANNLRCASKIMAHQVVKKDFIAAKSNYWAVIKPNSSWNKLPQIKQRIKTEFSGCF